MKILYPLIAGVLFLIGGFSIRHEPAGVTTPMLAPETSALVSALHRSVAE